MPEGMKLKKMNLVVFRISSIVIFVGDFINLSKNKKKETQKKEEARRENCLFLKEKKK